MGLTSRQIVIEVFDTFVETEPEGSTSLLQKVRDVLLYRIEKETIEIEPSTLGVQSTGREFSPDELVSFREDEQEITPEELIEPDFDIKKDDPIWEAPESSFEAFERDINS